jgi:hypothetical protein
MNELIKRLMDCGSIETRDGVIKVEKTKKGYIWIKFPYSTQRTERYKKEKIMLWKIYSHSFNEKVIV